MTHTTPSEGWEQSFRETIGHDDFCKVIQHPNSSWKCNCYLKDGIAFIRTLLHTQKVELVRETDSLLGLLKIAKCPDTNCDNAGTGVDGYGEPYQCQWCDERKSALDRHGITQV